MRGAIVLGWPLAIAVVGGYTRLAAEPRRFPARALLAAALGMATAVWSLPTLIPGAGTDESPRTLAAAALLLAAVVCLGSATARGLIALVAPSQSVPTVLVGPRSQVRELLQEAARPGGRRAFEPVAVCLPDPASDDFDPAPPRPGPCRSRAAAYDGLLRRRAHPPRRGCGRRPRAGHQPRRAAPLGRVAPGPRRRRSWSAPGLRDVARGRLAFTTLGGAGLVDVRPGARLSGRGRAGQGRRGPGRGGRGSWWCSARCSACWPCSSGPTPPARAVYRQTRVGRHGRLFTVYKLRTMRDGRRARGRAAGRGQRVRPRRRAVQDQARPTDHQIGSMLRAYSLDELPQL